MSKTTIPVATPCTWEGEQTTIGAVQRKYAGTCYRTLVAYAIALGGATDHAGLIRYDASAAARRRKGGKAAAKRPGCNMQVRK